MKKPLYIILGICLTLFIMLGIIGFYGYRSITQSPWATQDNWLYIHQGDKPDQILLQLSESCGDINDTRFQLALRLYGWDKSIQQTKGGAYLIRKGMTASQVVTKVTHKLQDPVNLTFIGTRTLPELAGKMAQNLAADSAQILEAMTAPAFLEECGCNANNVIGIFLPDTYQVYWTISPEKLMQRMLAEYRKFWTKERLDLASSLKVSPMQISILCSIAEEETADRKERGVVARLYWNRLMKGMLLQADPTVKYALGDFALRRILNKHLKADSPYNTYLHPGLPPGPIRVVDKATIDALLHSQSHKYIYMCAKEDFSGLHNFATTLSEHNKNANLYHAALKKNGIK